MKKIGVIILLICSLTLLIGCEKKEKNEKKKESKSEIVNPLTEVSTKEELEKLLGFEVPTIEEKEAINYIAIGDNDKKIQARIYYQDGSEFDMKKGSIKSQEEVSGIYGAEEIKTITIETIKISIYEYDETIFGVWKDKTYSYAYSMQNSDLETLTENLEKLIATKDEE